MTLTLSKSTLNQLNISPSLSLLWGDDGTGHRFCHVLFSLNLMILTIMYQMIQYYIILHIISYDMASNDLFQMI